jgi:TolB protein
MSGFPSRHRGWFDNILQTSMKSVRIWIFSICFAATLWAGDPPRKLAFERSGAVWVAKFDGTNAKKVAAGVRPDLARDGSRLAFNTESAEGKPFERRIAVVDLASGQVSVFSALPSNNSFGPKWSPDGTKLLFEIMDSEHWQLGVANADGTGFRYLKIPGVTVGLFNPGCWAPDGRSIFTQDLNTIYQIDLDGVVLKKWEISKLISGGDMSSESSLAISPDGTTLLIEAEMDEEDPGRKNWDGPPPAIWSFPLAAGTAKRLTPPKFFAWQPRWTGAGEIIFVSQAENEKQPSIYIAPVENLKARKLLMKNANMPSVSQ